MASRLLMKGAVLATLIVSTLALTSAGAPQPPADCPEVTNRYTLLMPSPGSDLPTNGSFWLTENLTAEGGGLQLIDNVTGDSLPFSEIRLFAGTRTLLQILPDSDLEPRRTYLLRFVDGQRYESMHEFTTSEGPDLLAPPTPDIIDVRSTRKVCYGHGLSVQASPDDGAPTILIATVAGSDELLSFSTPKTLHIPALEGALLRFELVAVDLSGNRSARTPMRTQEVGPADFDAVGCTCARSARGPSFLVLGLLAVLGYRRRLDS